MSISSFFERRRVPASIECKDQRIAKRRTQMIAFSPERRRLASQGRRYDRDALRIPVLLQIQEKNVSGCTRDITRGGLLVLSDTALRVGTPLALQCSFGEVCHLNLSGQVVFCHSTNGSASPGPYAAGIKFAGLRNWEERILSSALQELKENASTLEQSVLRLRVSEDHLAVEAAHIAGEAPERRGWPRPVFSVSGPMPTAGSVYKLQRRKSTRGRKFTPDPVWVVEMDQRLEPYRQAVWQTKLLQETSTGQLSLRQVKGWNIQLYPFIEYFPQFMATFLAKAPDPVSRAFLIDNLRVEKRHADQWIDMAMGFGVPREELFTTPILPDVEALTHWLWSVTNRGSFVEAIAATNYAIEGVTQGIATFMVKGFDKYHGKDGVFLDRKAYYWVEAHAAYDDLHPFQALEVMKLHATSVELQQKVEHAAQRSLEYLFRALEACYWAYAPEHAFA
jgi:pyrroloquinoline quinone (PQQ) biosynthesis protein C